MKLLNVCRKAILLSCLILQGSFLKAQQFLTQVNGWNAYIHLPTGYNNSGQYYPTIIYFPGWDNVGTDPQKAIATGPGAYIQQGWNGNVIVNGSTVEFIVVSLQPSAAFPSEYLINQRLQTLKNTYRIDPNRLYLTGLSHGGWCASTFVSGDNYGGPYNYAGQVAAVVNVIGVKPEDNQPYPALFDNFANSGGRYLGMEQRNDFRDIRTIVNRMNSTKANSAIYVQTNFGNGGHCCPEQFFGGQGVTPANFTLDGVNQNIYQWLSRQSRGSTPVNALPVANAGSDKSITLPTNSITVTGSGSDPDGTITSYLWTKVSGPAGGNISSSSSPSTTISNLEAGTYQFQLRVTDNAGASATDLMQVIVNQSGNQPPVANAGVDKNVILPTNSVVLTGSGSDPDGTISSYQWTKISGPSGGSIQSPSSASTSVNSLTAGTYTYQLRVTDNAAAYSTDQVQVVVSEASQGGIIRVNIFGGNNPYNSSAWNNWNINSGLTSPLLKYDDQTTSTIRAIMSDQAGLADNGSNYATSATFVDPSVLRYNSFNTSNRILTISGLTPGDYYDMKFFGSRANTGNRTVIQWGNVRDTINTDYNSNDYAELNNLLADGSGKLYIDIYRLGTYNYLAGFIISKAAARPATFSHTPGPPTDKRKEIISTATFTDLQSTSLYPNPFRDKVTVVVDNNYSGDYFISLINTDGQRLFHKKLNKASGRIQETINTYYFKPGVYLIEVLLGENRVVLKGLKL